MKGERIGRYFQHFLDRVEVLFALRAVDMFVFVCDTEIHWRSGTSGELGNNDLEYTGQVRMVCRAVGER